MPEERTTGRLRAAEALDRDQPHRSASYGVNRATARAYWPGLDAFQGAWVARTASDLGLSVLQGDVVWRNGHPHVTFQGVLALLNRDPRFDSCWVDPTPPEVRRELGVARGEGACWQCVLWRKDRSHPAIAYGLAAGREARQVELAQERALRQAARLAFGWPLTCPEEALRLRTVLGGAAPGTPQGPNGNTAHTDAERQALWTRVTGLLAALPAATPRQARAWLRREAGTTVDEGVFASMHPPRRLTTRALRRLATALEDYRSQLLGEV